MKMAAKTEPEAFVLAAKWDIFPLARPHTLVVNGRCPEKGNSETPVWVWRLFCTSESTEEAQGVGMTWCTWHAKQGIEEFASQSKPS